MTIALMTGQRGELKPQTLDHLRAAGLAHLLAISGLHIGLVATSLFFFLRLSIAAWPWLGVRIQNKKWAAGAALIGAAAYLLLTGATIPTQRAFLMLAVFLGAILLDRNALSLRAVALAAFIVLCLHPESLISASFQLSFAAVVALIAVYEAAREPLTRLRSRAGWGRKIALYIGGVGLTTLVAGFATMPYALAHFNQAATYGLIGNLLAVPIMAFAVMPGAVLAFVAMPLGLEELLLQFVALAIDAILLIADWVATLPGSVRGVATPGAFFLPALTIAGLWLCLWRGRGRLFALPVGAVIIVAGVFLPPEKPVVLVSETGRAIAVFDPDRNMVSRGVRKASLITERWQRQWDGNLSGENAASANIEIRCDKLGCIFDQPELRIAHIKDARAFIEDCSKSDLVIAIMPAPKGCRPKYGVYDRFEFWRQGAHAFYLTNGKLRVETVRGQQGHWPWQRRVKSESKRKN